MSDKDFEFHIPRGADVVTKVPCEVSLPPLPPSARSRTPCSRSAVLRPARDASSRRAQREPRRITTSPSPNTQSCSRQPRRPRRQSLARTAQAARLAGSLHHGAPAGLGQSSMRRWSNTSCRELNPAQSAQEEMRRAPQIRAKDGRREEGKTRLETLIAQSLDSPAARYGLPEDIKLPDSMMFREANSRDVFTRAVRPTEHRLRPGIPRSTGHHRSAQSQARRGADKVTSSTRNFWSQRTTHDHDHARHAGQAPRGRGRRDRPHVLSEQRRPQGNHRHPPHRRRCASHRALTATNAITIKDTPERIGGRRPIITAIDKARPEVVIDVELSEVDRTRLNEHGLQIASPGVPPGINGAGRHQPPGLTLTTCATSPVPMSS